jgi:hypothetical protein
VWGIAICTVKFQVIRLYEDLQPGLQICDKVNVTGNLSCGQHVLLSTTVAPHNKIRQIKSVKGFDVALNN